MGNRPPLTLRATAVGALLLVLLLPAGCNQPIAEGPTSKPTSASVASADPVVRKAVDVAGGGTGRIVGYVADFRLTTRRSGSAASTGTLELVVMDDGRLLTPPSLMGGPLGAWDATPAARAMPVSLADRERQQSVVSRAARELPGVMPRSYGKVEVNAAQVFAYVVRVIRDGRTADVQVDPSARTAGLLGTLDAWPPR